MTNISINFPNNLKPKVINQTINIVNGEPTAIFTYDNGFELTATAKSDGTFDVKTNEPLINNGDGTLTVLL